MPTHLPLLAIIPPLANSALYPCPRRHKFGPLDPPRPPTPPHAFSKTGSSFWACLDRTCDKWCRRDKRSSLVKCETEVSEKACPHHGHGEAVEHVADELALVGFIEPRGDVAVERDALEGKFLLRQNKPILVHEVLLVFRAQAAYLPPHKRPIPLKTLGPKGRNISINELIEIQHGRHLGLRVDATNIIKSS